MASAKRKQDEKNLKILRELVSQPGNKECFDCRQRGPTYVNMTIGSFVCTSCSGILRGLTPPHRVKSISMATFTQDEINYLKEHGNEYCRRIWLGLLSPDNSPLNMDTKDEQKMKDLMSQKYELKRYYLEAPLNTESSSSKSQQQSSKSNTNKVTVGSSNSSSSSGSGIPRVPLNSETTSPTIPMQNKVKSQADTVKSFVPDFVADFSKVPDPFSISTSVQKNSQPIAPQPSFANFDNNPIFSNTKSNESVSFSYKLGSSSLNLNGINSLAPPPPPPPEDRYAALKDLDSLMKQAQLKEENLSSKSPWNSNNSNTLNANWEGLNNAAHVISNPFANQDLWQPTVNLVVNNNNNNNNIDNNIVQQLPIDNSCTNPFRPAHLPLNNDSQWSVKETTRNNEDVVISSSQLMAPFSGKMWQPSVTAYHANPFVVGGSGVGDLTRNSNNPFL